MAVCLPARSDRGQEAPLRGVRGDRYDRAMEPLPLAHDYIEGLNAEWNTLASPGTWWSGSDRVALAAVARAARDGDAPPSTDLPAPAVEAAARIAAHPHVDAAWVASLADQGLAPEAYVEIIGVVGRLAAVDSFMFGIGAGPQPLPAPIDGTPTRTPAADAGMHGALAPTVGPPGAPGSLSAVPAEVDAMVALHSVLYLSLEEMGDPGIEKTLTRAQMELIAARTSLLNDCFY